MSKRLPASWRLQIEGVTRRIVEKNLRDDIAKASRSIVWTFTTRIDSNKNDRKEVQKDEGTGKGD